MLSETERAQLLKIARKAIEARVRDNTRYDARLDADSPALTEALQQPCGAFVTLHKGGELRGCIGLIEAVKPLYQSIQEMAVAAAVHDPRFPPVRAAELAESTSKSPPSRRSRKSTVSMKSKSAHTASSSARG